MSSEVKARQAYRQALIEWMSPGSAHQEHDDVTEFCEWLINLQSEMVSLTEISLNVLAERPNDFGDFAIALNRDSTPAKRCEPVQYVIGEGTFISLIRQIHCLHGIMDTLMKEDDTHSIYIESAREINSVIEQLNVHCLGLAQDAAYRFHHEWRFIPRGNEDKLLFEPGDVKFIVVDTRKRADQWEIMLSDRSDPVLSAYHDAGVYVKCMEDVRSKVTESQ